MLAGGAKRLEAGWAGAGVIELNIGVEDCCAADPNTGLSHSVDVKKTRVR